MPPSTSTAKKSPKTSGFLFSVHLQGTFDVLCCLSLKVALFGKVYF